MRKLTAIAIGLVGTVLFVDTISGLASPISVFYFTQIPMRQRLIGAALLALPLLARLVITVYLFVARDRIAAWYVPEGSDVPVVAPVALAQAGIALVGIFVLCEALPALATTLVSPVFSWIQQSAAELDGQFAIPSLNLGEWFVGNAPRILGAVLSIALGVVLLVKRAAVAVWMMGVAPGASEPPADPWPAHCPNCGAGYDPADYDPAAAAETLCVNCHAPLEIRA